MTGFTEYLVKWRNYDDPEENTWEPLDNLGDAEKAIKAFEKDQEIKTMSTTTSKNSKRKGAPGTVASQPSKLLRRIRRSKPCQRQLQRTARGRVPLERLHLNHQSNNALIQRRNPRKDLLEVFQLRKLSGSGKMGTNCSS